MRGGGSTDDRGRLQLAVSALLRNNTRPAYLHFAFPALGADEAVQFMAIAKLRPELVSISHLSRVLVQVFGWSSCKESKRSFEN